MKYEDEITLIVSKLLALSEKDENEVYGNLNYIVYSIIKKYVDKKGMRYFRFNNLIGVLECIKSELYRRQVSTYENSACDKNGDV
jgi:hypothetical protein